MTTQTQEQGREEKIDYFYGQPIGSRRLAIEKLHDKLQKKYFALCDKLHKKYHGSFDKIVPSDTLKGLAQQGYFELLHNSNVEHKNLDESPLGRIVHQEVGEIFDRSDQENMLEASDSIFRNDSDPVLSTILHDCVYELNVPGHTRRERKKVRHRRDIFGRRLQKHVYERYLSEAVGKPITVEEYEREFGFLSDKSETK